MRRLKEDPLQLIHRAWRRSGGSPGSWARRPQPQEVPTPEESLGLARWELVAEAVLEAERVWKVVLMLEEEVEQMVKKAPPSSS